MYIIKNKFTQYICKDKCLRQTSLRSKLGKCYMLAFFAYFLFMLFNLFNNKHNGLIMI